MAAASIKKLSDIKFSANWMAAAGHGMEDQKLFDAVSALGEDFCPKLGVTIPVGKDSLSMRSVWEENGQQKSVVSPLSVIISGFAPAFDVNSSLTPQLRREENATLIYIDISGGHNRLGGSALAQVYNQVAKQRRKNFSIPRPLGRWLVYDACGNGFCRTLRIKYKH
jgi:phosphoribosylformylglycinamidine synthase